MLTKDIMKKDESVNNNTNKIAKSKWARKKYKVVIEV